MKYFFTALLLLIFAAAQAQVSNFTYTDCNSTTQSIYDVLAQNKVLIIASKGLDCSICMGQAPNLQTFAASEKSRITVWGAMNFKYSANVPNCTQLNNWKLSYLWNDIFMFIDSNDDWEGQGYPTYYVVSPFDSAIVYEGVLWSQTSAKALELADSIGLPTAIAPAGNSAAWSAQLAAGTLNINFNGNMPEGNIGIMLTDVSGKVMMSYREKAMPAFSFPLSEKLSAGIYMLTIKNEAGIQLQKKFLLVQ